MLSSEFQRFVNNLRTQPCDNPSRTGYAELRRIQEERITTEETGCPDIEQKLIQVDGIQAEWLIPGHAPKDKAVVYIHGGGWSLGGIRQTRRFLAPMVRRFGVQTIHFDYRLMPENPYPAGLDDCERLYCGLLRDGWRAENLVLAGESAGANLALALLLRLKAQGIPQPLAASLISPITFMDTMEGSHSDLAGLDLILAEDSFLLDVVAELYAPGMDKRDACLSPLYGDLRGLPAMQLFVGTDEKLFEDTIRFYYKSRQSGNDVELVVGDHMPHSWPIFLNDFPEAEAAARTMAEFIRRVLLRRGREQEARYERQLVQAVLDEIEQNYRCANLSAIAGRYAQTVYGYSKLIRRQTGLTYKQLLKSRRFAVVEEQLKDTDKSIKEIAFDVGYENLTHFYQLFRNRYGKTPQELRKELRLNDKIAKDDSGLSHN